MACTVVNGGHNDALVGLALLLAVIDVRRERYGRAGWWIAAALLVKVTAGLALLPIVAWVWVHGDWVAVRRVVAGPLLVALPVMLVTPGLVSSLGHGQIGVVSRTSIWNLALRLPALFGPHAPHATGALLGPLAFAVVVGVAVCAAWGTRHRRDPTPGVVAALAAWLVFGGYVLPWYTVWALPVAALVPLDEMTWVVAVQGAAITAAWMIPRSTIGAGGLVSDAVRFVIPLAIAAMFVWALLGTLGLRGRGQGSVAPWLNHAGESGDLGGRTRRSPRANGVPLVRRRSRLRRARAGADPASGDGPASW